MTVARLGVEREKNNVASLKTCAACVKECQIRNNQQTFNEEHSWRAMPHSSSLSSYCRRPAVLLLVTSSIAARYCSAKFNISNVEFHRVDTSRGILRAASFICSSVWNHAGNRIVVEWIMANEILCSCRYQVSDEINNKYSTTHLHEDKFDRADTRVQGLTILCGQCVSLINPAVIVVFGIVGIVSILLFPLHLLIFKINPLCKHTELFFRLVQSFVFFPLRNIKLSNDTFRHETKYMEETAGLVRFSRKAGKEIGELINHRVVARCIVACDTQNLVQS